MKEHDSNILKTELFRKSIHISSSIVPVIAHFYYATTILMILSVTLIYIINEYLRFSGFRNITLLTKITALASRERDNTGIVLGPVALAAGVISALLLYPEKIAAISIIAVSLGDGFASLAGKTWGKKKLFYSDKSIIGSTACFLAVFIPVCFITGGDIISSLILAFTAAFIESLPIKDLDNILIPAGTGFVGVLINV